MEQSSEYYNHLYETREMYSRSYKDSPYYVLWTQIIYFLRKRKDHKILEMGCGPGQFAAYLKDEGFSAYEGFDYSEEAIHQAKKRNPKISFFQGDVYDERLYITKDFDVAICLEVLEHLDGDRRVVKAIPEGKIVVITVPSFDDESHVRWFRSERQVKSRYYDLIDIQQLVRVNSWYLLLGERRDFKPDFFQFFLKTREKVGIGSFLIRVRHHIKNKFKLKFL